jgi:hypothetical protein
MADSLKLAVLCAYSVFGVLVSVSGLPLAAALACSSFVFAWALVWLTQSLPETTFDVWDLAPFLAFSPLLFAYVTTPGADAAMYAAIARALLDGSPDLSAAYPGVQVSMYPRAYPGLIAVLTPSLGMPKACLMAALLAYVAYVTGLSFWLRKVATPKRALVTALFIALVGRNVPLGFFSWGGNPTIMAFGMALTAVSLAADAWQRALLVCSALVLTGAFAVHPIGAFGGAACAPLVLAWPKLDFVRARRVCTIALVALPLAFAFKQMGPAISVRESDWITRWQLGPANLLHNRFGMFPYDYLEAFGRGCGIVLTGVSCACLIGALRVRGEPRKLAWLTLFGLGYVALLVAVGPKLPLIGTFIYADRLSPIWLVALGPLLAAMLARQPAWSKPLQLTAAALAIALAHTNWRNGEPLMNEDELALTACIRKQVPERAWIVASYGQGGQWLPAMTGHPITQAHTHCSLFDETDAVRAKVDARYQLVSQHAAQYAPELPALPALETLCEHGGAKLVRLIAAAPPIPGIY